MSEFVEECRREWRRLGVPDPVADEMAGDLEADLAEGESEGASAVEVLGTGASDPRSFAASWATERGIVPSRPSEQSSRRRGPTLATVVTLAAVATIGASLAILASDSGRRVAQFRVLAPSYQEVSPAMQPVSVTPDGVWVGVTPDEVTIRVPESGFDIRPVGWALLIVGLVGIVPALVLWSSWARARRPAAAA